MDLSDILANAADQDKGRELVVVDPWNGRPIGMTMRIAGPDSDTQKRARIAMMDELADMARPDGSVSAEMRELARLNSLARCVLGWDVNEAGAPVPFNHKNVVRALKAATWLQAQVDAFAGDRANFRPEGL